ncbi:Alpha-1,3-mannosyl-glycoprotein 4-beta-N-acetylglucosaminyltransferase C, partial [Lamellibrachia satsuma]
DQHNSSLSNVLGATLFHVKPRYTNVIAKPRRREGFLTIGIPSMKRPTGHVYVLNTIQSIVNTTSPRDRDQIVIVVFLTDFDAAYNENLTATIVAVYGRYIESGLIHVVRVAREAYPPLDNLKRNFNDAKDRVTWRSKQVVDFALMFLYAPNISRYYIQIEDDVRCANGFVPSIQRFLERLAERRRRWTIVEFSSLGFIGKLLHSTDLRTFAHFLLLFYQEQPVDYLISQFRLAMAQGEVILCRPTLFQHVGLKSSLRLTAKDKDNTLKDKFFNDGTQPHPNNPSAVVVSSMVAQSGYLPQQAYDGDTYFWAQTPLTGSTVDVTFSAPVRLSRVAVFTGSREHPVDILLSGVLEACTGPRRTSAGRDCPSSQVLQLGQFVNGSIDVTVPPSTLPVLSLRVLVTHAQEAWIIFRLIAVYTS